MCLGQLIRRLTLIQHYADKITRKLEKVELTSGQSWQRRLTRIEETQTLQTQDVSHFLKHYLLFFADIL